MAAKVQGKWRVIDPINVGMPSDLAQIDTAPAVPLGTVVTAQDMGATNYGVGQFIYVKGVASTVAGNVVYVKGSDFSIVRITAGSQGIIGLALSALDAATKYGWVQISGKGVATCVAGIADAAALFLCGTAGAVDDTVVAADDIMGLISASTDDTSTCLVYFPNGASTSNEA